MNFSKFKFKINLLDQPTRPIMLDSNTAKCYRVFIDGSMYIGNIHWKYCRLETSFAFGNMNWIFETKIGYWKHKFYIGNIVWYIGNNAFGNLK